jgi:hypothetical protein
MNKPITVEQFSKLTLVFWLIHLPIFLMTVLLWSYFSALSVYTAWMIAKSTSNIQIDECGGQS